MQLLKLSCANCSAPLEIGGDLERFACSYCGTEQIVERSGGIVWLRKVETAIQAVLRSSDRTAAELALARLDRELDETQATRAELIRMAKQQAIGVPIARALCTLMAMAVAVMLASILHAIFFGKHFHTWHAAFWAIAIIGVLIAVYRSLHKPPTDIQQSVAELDARIADIEAQTLSNRAIVATPPA